jgi:hypothetical protein
MILNRDAILSAQDLPHEDVQVSEWGGAVRVRMMTGAERDALANAFVGADGKPDMSGYRQRLLAATMIDEAGQRLFTADDLAAIGSKSAAALDRVFAVADRINQLGGVAVEAATGN